MPLCEHTNNNYLQPTKTTALLHRKFWRGQLLVGGNPPPWSTPRKCDKMGKRLDILPPTEYLIVTDLSIESKCVRNTAATRRNYRHYYGTITRDYSARKHLNCKGLSRYTRGIRLFGSNNYYYFYVFVE